MQVGLGQVALRDRVVLLVQGERGLAVPLAHQALPEQERLVQRGRVAHQALRVRQEREQQGLLARVDRAAHQGRLE